MKTYHVSLHITGTIRLEEDTSQPSLFDGVTESVSITPKQDFYLRRSGFDFVKPIEELTKSEAISIINLIETKNLSALAPYLKISISPLPTNQKKRGRPKKKVEII